MKPDVLVLGDRMGVRTVRPLPVQQEEAMNSMKELFPGLPLILC